MCCIRSVDGLNTCRRIYFDPLNKREATANKTPATKTTVATLTVFSFI